MKIDEVKVKDKQFFITICLSHEEMLKAAGYDINWFSFLASETLIRDLISNIKIKEV